MAAVVGPLPPQVPPSQSATARLTPIAKKTSFTAEHIIVHNGSLWRFSREFFPKDAKERSYIKKEFESEIAQKGKQLLERLEGTGALEQTKFRILPPRPEEKDTFRVTVRESEVSVKDPELASHLLKLSGLPLALEKRRLLEVDLKKATPIGFKNCGNTCHLSSVMTFLTTNAFLRETILAEHQCPNENPLILILQQYKDQLKKSDFKAIDLQKLANTLGLEGDQEDWDETFQKVMKQANLPKNSALHAQAIYRYLTKDGLILEREETEKGVARINMTLPENSENGQSFSLQQLLSAALCVDVESEDRFITSDDRSQRFYLKKEALTFAEAPNVLIIYVRRYDNNGNKRNNPIDFPLEFSFRTKPVREDDQTQTYGRYALRGVSLHQGSSGKTGHYTTGVRSRDGVCWECSDSHVLPLKSQKQLQAKRESAYVFVYNRVS